MGGLGPGGLGPSNRGTPKNPNPFHFHSFSGIRSDSRPPTPTTNLSLMEYPGNTRLGNAGNRMEIGLPFWTFEKTVPGLTARSLVGGLGHGTTRRHSSEIVELELCFDTD